MTGSITQCTPNSFFVELLTGTHNFTTGTGDTFKIALFKSTVTGTYGTATTNYSDMTGNSDELPAASGYSTGGFTLTNITPVIGGTTAYCSFSVNPNWPASTLSSSGALIYNSSKANRCVALLAFGSVISSSASTFLITLPSNDQNNAIIRVGSS